MRRPLIAAAAATAVALILSGCGTSEPEKASSDKKSEPITLTDAGGASVKLDGPAKKVVGTEWNVVESMVTLGVDPVGVADVKGYKAWDSAVPLKNDPKDIGTRGEPSMDTLAGLTPDLIVTTTDMSASAVKQMKKVAPVLQVKAADGADQVGQMFDTLDVIAKATGTTSEAKKAKESYEAKVAEGKKALKEAELDGSKVAFADGYAASNQVSIRGYTSNSLLGAVNEDLGLKNDWKIKGDKDYGLATTDVEGLTALGDDVKFVYLGNKSDGSSDVFTDELADNSVWKSLPFVKDDEVHRLPDGIWMFGGPEAMEAYIDALVDSLKK
ncbi:siderophore ABC transporter substrate-binding protein CdtB [Streptomyces durmitorensis]|uniref:Iron-siderophore ABC transporter substrate-binding protein n=1 Tax=Streptomyces durmitorensis TaxID=319947 RepID=A0ABY4PKW1_9ACTN|nr:iron-siderophore ABC transporter substrate-binding protein [Streptomyces durmitorensis]UQT54020.1 iron-siderophore ABC transporter substrate-binding protein [Streptomyces durmitorensis]